MQARPFRAVSCRQALPVGRIKRFAYLGSGTCDLPLHAPGSQDVGGIDAKHVASPQASEATLDLANAIHAVGGNPTERYAGRRGTRDHPRRQMWLRGEANIVRNIGRLKA